MKALNKSLYSVQWPGCPPGSWLWALREKEGVERILLDPTSSSVSQNEIESAFFAAGGKAPSPGMTDNNPYALRTLSGTVLRALHEIIPYILLTTLGGSYYYPRLEAQ
jgi:hypothetical protein